MRAFPKTTLIRWARRASARRGGPLGSTRRGAAVDGWLGTRRSDSFTFAMRGRADDGRAGHMANGGRNAAQLNSWLTKTAASNKQCGAALPLAKKRRGSGAAGEAEQLSRDRRNSGAARVGEATFLLIYPNGE